MATETRQARQMRAAKTQSLYRDVNERLEELRPSSTFTEFICECALDDCAAPLPMTIEEYEEVRRDPNHFVVKPGHVVDEAERIVASGPRFVTVAKIGAAADVATYLDPRARPGRREQ